MSPRQRMYESMIGATQQVTSARPSVIMSDPTTQVITQRVSVDSRPSGDLMADMTPVYTMAETPLNPGSPAAGGNVRDASGQTTSAVLTTQAAATAAAPQPWYNWFIENPFPTAGLAALAIWGIAELSQNKSKRK